MQKNRNSRKMLLEHWTFQQIFRKMNQTHPLSTPRLSQRRRGQEHLLTWKIAGSGLYGVRLYGVRLYGGVVQNRTLRRENI